ncbi:Profilin [Exaiptasia diaphana]|nr:Profilin [Exaiptasia diaphana]
MYMLQGQEGANIAKCFKSKDFSAFMASGIRAEGEKYQFLRVEDDKTVFGKKKDHGAITIQASKTALVIGHTAEGCQQGNSNKAVAVIAEYLESLGM